MTDDQLTQAETIYRVARDSGKDKTSAKRAVRAQLPDFYEAINTDKAYLAKWGRVVQLVEKSLNGGLKKAANGNGQTPLFPEAPPTLQYGAVGFTRWAFENWAEIAAPLKVGDTYSFSPELYLRFLQIAGIKITSPGSFVNEFLASQRKNSRLQADGWSFETVPGSSYKWYTVRITAVPAPPAPVPQPVAPAPAASTGDNKLFEEFAAFMAWRNANQS